MTRIFLLALTFFSCIYSFSSSYIRYNHAGYFPDQKKRVIILSDESLLGKIWTLSNSSNLIIKQGVFGVKNQGVTDYTAQAYNYTITFTDITNTGAYAFEIVGIITQTIEIKNNPYQGIVSDVLKGIRARRSGSTDALVHAVSHVGDSSCAVYRNDLLGNTKANYIVDAGGLKMNLSGGWYDAGDYIKFTLTNAYTAYRLLKTYQLNPNKYRDIKDVSTTQYNDLLDEAFFGLNYLTKTLNGNDFVIQVGDETDHQQWPIRLPENDTLNSYRKAYIASAKPQLGLTVAALALGARICIDEGYMQLASLYQQKAITAYTLATGSNAIDAAWYEKDGEVFYQDNTHQDNLKIAAYELYKLTGQQNYLNQAKAYMVGVSYWISWGDLSLMANNTLYQNQGAAVSAVTTSLAYFKGLADASGNIWDMPHESTWGTLYSYFGVANGALTYESQSDNDQYRDLATDVLDYTMGLNNWGLGFVATERVSGTLTSSYAQMYRLQTSIFPTGEIAEGPTTLSTHNDNKQYFYPEHDSTLFYKDFNTPNLTFFQQEGDFVCMETIITGLSDGLYMFALAEKLLAIDATTSIFDKNSLETASSYVYPNPAHDKLSIELKELEAERISVFDIKGNHILSNRVHDNKISDIDVSTWSNGIYTVIIFLSNSKTKMETFEKL